MAVSVVMPALDAGRFIEAAIRSLLRERDAVELDIIADRGLALDEEDHPRDEIRRDLLQAKPDADTKRAAQDRDSGQVDPHDRHQEQEGRAEDRHDLGRIAFPHEHHEHRRNNAEGQDGLAIRRQGEVNHLCVPLLFGGDLVGLRKGNRFIAVLVPRRARLDKDEA